MAITTALRSSARRCWRSARRTRPTRCATTGRDRAERAARPAAGPGEQVGDAHDLALPTGCWRSRCSTATRGPRDAAALPRPPSGPGRHRYRVRRADQRYASVEEFIAAHSGSPGSPRWSGSSQGCRSSSRWCPGTADPGAQVPAPAHRHPKQTIGYGGCFSCIYSVRGAGGYQMFGITLRRSTTRPVAAGLRDSWCSSAGRHVKFTPIDRERYDATSPRWSRDVPDHRAAGRVQPAAVPGRPDGYNAGLLEVLR